MNNKEYGKAAKSGLDLIMVGVGFIPVVGTAVSSAYFIGDVYGWDKIILNANKDIDAKEAILPKGP